MFYKVVTSDQYGHFVIKNVDPGEYKAYAWEDVELGAYMDPDFLKPVENRGQAVSIHDRMFIPAPAHLHLQQLAERLLAGLSRDQHASSGL
jgi:hypothetical protein